MTRRSTLQTASAALATCAVGYAAYATFALLRPRLYRWGADDDELERDMPGESRVREPTRVLTFAVTVDARPAEVWPWLLQIGYRRGGLYSYDWLDRLFGYLDRPSATVVMPRFQRLEVGDSIPVGHGPSWPVVEIAPERALVLEPVAGMVSWVFELLPLGDDATRLVTRVRYRVERTAASTAVLVAMDPAVFLMIRRMLLGIRDRAEALAAHRRVTPRARKRQIA